MRTPGDVRPAMQEVLDTALAMAPASAQAHFSLVLAEREYGPGRHKVSTAAQIEDVASLTAWITATNASDEAIQHVERAAMALAERHTQVPARRLLPHVLAVHGKAQLLLRSGRQRLRQTRELVRIDGTTLSLASVLLGDPGQDQEATNYGRAALVFLQEADARTETAMYALAKTARWQHDYAMAADVAEQGFEPGPVDPMTVQLAYYEANSAALLGDQHRARQALMRADQIAEAVAAEGPASSPWSFPAERRAIFRLSVLLRTGDPDGALAAAAEADQGWKAGDLYIPGTWAQVRTGAAIAHLQQDSLDGAAEQVSPVLTLAPEFRIATVTGWLDDLDKHLAQPRFSPSRIAGDLRQQIRDSALPLCRHMPFREAGMTLPAQMRDRWRDRPQPRNGEGTMRR